MSGSLTSLPLGLPITGSNIKGCLIFVRILIYFLIFELYSNYEVRSQSPHSWTIRQMTVADWRRRGHAMPSFDPTKNKPTLWLNIVLGDLPDASCSLRKSLSLVNSSIFSFCHSIFFLHICNSCALLFSASCAVGAADAPKINTCHYWMNVENLIKVKSLDTGQITGIQ